jgi:hypothetical protein
MVRNGKLSEWASMDKALKVRGKSIFCNVCNRHITADQGCHVRQHILSDLHKKSVETGGQKQPDIRNHIKVQSTAEKDQQFSRQMCR